MHNLRWLFINLPIIMDYIDRLQILRRALRGIPMTFFAQFLQLPLPSQKLLLLSFPFLFAFGCIPCPRIFSLLRLILVLILIRILILGIFRHHLVQLIMILLVFFLNLVQEIVIETSRALGRLFHLRFALESFIAADADISHLLQKLLFIVNRLDHLRVLFRTIISKIRSL